MNGSATKRPGKPRQVTRWPRGRPHATGEGRLLVEQRRGDADPLQPRNFHVRDSSDLQAARAAKSVPRCGRGPWTDPSRRTRLPQGAAATTGLMRDRTQRFMRYRDLARGRTGPKVRPFDGGAMLPVASAMPACPDRPRAIESSARPAAPRRLTESTSARTSWTRRPSLWRTGACGPRTGPACRAGLLSGRP